MEKPRRTANRHGTRRRFLQSAGLAGVGSVLRVGQVTASGRETATRLDTTLQRESLLPADRTYPNAPRLEAETAGSSSEYFERNEASADRGGRTLLDFDGGLDGEGRFGVTGAPALETTWRAPRTGEHVVKARYRARGGLRHDFGDDTLVSSFPKTTLAVIDTDTGTRTARTFLDAGIVSPDIDEFLLETGIKFLATRLIPSFFGPLGRFIAGFVIGPVIDWIVPDPSGEDDFAPTYERQIRFWAREGHTYRIRFYTIGGGAGTSRRAGSSCRTRLSVETTLHELSIYPVGFSMPHTLVVSKDGTPEGLGMYAVTVGGDLARGKDSEAEVEGTTALDWVGPKRGTDRLQYSGSLDKFLLKGNAVGYRDGNRIDPLGDDSASGAGLPNTLTVTKEGAGRGLGAFTVTVSGELESSAESEAAVSGSSALDWVGPERGTDRLHYSGEITDLILKGNARVYRNGARINPDAV